MRSEATKDLWCGGETRKAQPFAAAPEILRLAQDQLPREAF